MFRSVCFDAVQIQFNVDTTPNRFSLALWCRHYKHQHEGSPNNSKGFLFVIARGLCKLKLFGFRLAGTRLDTFHLN